MDKYKLFFRRIKDAIYRKKAAEEKAAKRKRLITILTIFFVCALLLILIGSPIVIYEFLYQDKIYVGVNADGLDLSGLTRNQAIDKLNQYIDNLKQNGLNFYYQNEKLNVDFSVISPQDPDLAYQILNFEVEPMVNQAYQYGRQNDWLTNLQNQLLAVLKKKQIPLIYNLNQAELQNSLQQKFSPLEQPAEDAKIIFAENGQFKISAEKSGFILDYGQAVSDLAKQLNLVKINPIEIKSKPSLAQVSKIEAELNSDLITEALRNEKIVWQYKDSKWEIPKDEFKNWIIFVKNNNQVELAFNPEMLKSKLNLIGQEINILPQDAKIVMTDGKVTEFLVHKNGLELDIDNSIFAMNQEFFTNKKNEIALVVKEIEPAVKTEQVNDMGIKEIIGVGVSDFTGSHTNRIKNITNAATHLNGMLIAPGDEFSLSDRLGPVNGETGYFQEFVIKGDRTIPEYGGGLCQIATTTFRAALYSGLPITERHPHSYIVTYYKPIGMDAAIYQPHPDIRFINDTGHYVLIQTYIKGVELKFEFWGTKDGRTVEITDPETFNWTSPGPDRLIENPKLKPGEKKLMEKARRGADASFYRYVTMPGQEKKEEIYRSHYVAWPNIYEVGIQEVKPPEPATGTDLPPDEISLPSPTPAATVSAN